MVLTFSKADGEQLHRGPFTVVRFQGEVIRDSNGSAIASHLPHGWRVDGKDYLRLDINDPVKVTWEGFAGSAATTGHLSCVDGIAHIDRRILAFVDRQRNDWYLLRDGIHQAVLIVHPA